jgi:hypothetical protein
MTSIGFQVAMQPATLRFGSPGGGLGTFGIYLVLVEAHHPTRDSSLEAAQCL